MKIKKSRLILYAVSVIVIIISIFFFQFCIVSGDSMYPTLQDGNLLLMNKYSDNYQRYDIIVIRNGYELIIKRIVALPGETVKICDDKIFINGEKIEDVVNCPTNPGIAESEISLGEGEYFVLGDNRENSRDSRDVSVGVVKASMIKGEVVKSILPFRTVK